MAETTESHALTIERVDDRLLLAGDPVPEVWMTEDLLRDADEEYVEVTDTHITFHLDNACLIYERTGYSAESRVHTAKLDRWWRDA